MAPKQKGKGARAQQGPKKGPANSRKLGKRNCLKVSDAPGTISRNRSQVKTRAEARRVAEKACSDEIPPDSEQNSHGRSSVISRRAKAAAPICPTQEKEREFVQREECSIEEHVNNEAKNNCKKIVAISKFNL